MKNELEFKRRRGKSKKNNELSELFQTYIQKFKMVYNEFNNRQNNKIFVLIQDSDRYKTATDTRQGDTT